MFNSALVLILQTTYLTPKNRLKHEEKPLKYVVKHEF